MQFDTLFPVHNPSKRAHPQNEIRVTRKDTNFGDTMYLCYLEPEKCQNLPRNYTNFSNAIILHCLEPAKCQIHRERHKFCTKLHSLTQQNAKESIHFSRISHIVFLNALINPIHTSQTTTWEHLVA